MKAMRFLIPLLAVVSIALAAKKSYDKAPEMKIDPAKTYAATIDTSKGKIVVSLFAKDAPMTVNNFVFLAREGFYNGTTFHRVIPGFMIQGGDPDGNGTGGPGYEFQNENAASTHGFPPGTLAMANAGPNTNGSQFFINDANSPWLTADKYTIFGEVTSGQDVVNQIAKSPAGPNDMPREKIEIKSIAIEEK